MNNLPIRDIHLPPPPGWWPPATGWWLLAALLLLVLCILLWRRYHRRRRTAQQLALHSLQQLEQQFRRHGDKSRLLQDISILLRRVCMSYGSRRQSAGLIEQAWLQHIETLGQNKALTAHFARLLSDGPYQPQVDYDADALLQHCRQWIAALPHKRPGVRS